MLWARGGKARRRTPKGGEISSIEAGGARKVSPGQGQRTAVTFWHPSEGEGVRGEGRQVVGGGRERGDSGDEGEVVGVGWLGVEKRMGKRERGDGMGYEEVSD